jgi:hypothetical protein
MANGWMGIKRLSNQSKPIQKKGPSIEGPFEVREQDTYVRI